MMDADFDDDYDPRISGMDDLGDDQPSPDDSFDVDQAEEGQFDDSDIEEQQEDGDEVFEGDVDEEMQDRGMDVSRNALQTPLILTPIQSERQRRSRLIYVRSLHWHHGPCPPPNQAAASPPSAIPLHNSTGNPMVRSHTR